MRICCIPERTQQLLTTAGAASRHCHREYQVRSRGALITGGGCHGAPLHRRRQGRPRLLAQRQVEGHGLQVRHLSAARAMRDGVLLARRRPASSSSTIALCVKVGSMSFGTSGWEQILQRTHRPASPQHPRKKPPNMLPARM